ncbi:MAG: hypothetical protein B6D56_05340 [Candidatus Omnitrophica bacterium 4484_70.1]|nr:MAG: hypothetical protein B6D56_05340 [Candidatus Omnitrophica bacterium 4484_70.1]
MKKFIILLSIISLSILTGKAEENSLSPQLKKDIYSQEREGFFNWINKNAYAKSMKEDKKLLRREWKKMLGGVDIFFPYFKAKEVEKWIKKKARVDFFKVKGEPSFKKDKVQYIFKINF